VAFLAEERAGRDYNKSEYRRSVIAAIGRKPGSIERKLQNVSAALDEIGIPWIQGYKPLPHYQDALVAVVERQILQHPELFEATAAGPLQARDENDILMAPPPLLNSDPESRPAAIRRPGRQVRPRGQRRSQQGPGPRWRGVRGEFRATPAGAGGP
jgi:hypothetical protein